MLLAGDTYRLRISHAQIHRVSSPALNCSRVVPLHAKWSYRALAQLAMYKYGEGDGI